MVLTLNVVIPAGDVTPPTILPPDATISEPTSSPEISIPVTITDDLSGVSSVTMAWGEQSVEAQLQEENVFTGTVSNLVSGVPTEITVTATDCSRARNQSQLTLMVTYDETAEDRDKPVITFISPAKKGERVQAAEGTIVCTVSDASGLDTVWWTSGVDEVFGGSIAVQADGTYSFPYTLPAYQENILTVHAKDGSAAHNYGQNWTTLMYNVPPAVPVIETPEAGATGIATSPTLTWTGGDDPDQDPVSYLVHYKKSTETVFITAPVSAEKSATLTELEPNTEYTWKVVAYSETYPDSVVCEPGTFTTAGTGPSISKQPTAPTEAIQPGGSFTLTVEASGTPAPTYQWYKDGVSIPGATESTLSVSNVSKEDVGEYYVVVINVEGEVKSTTASITVQEPVAITTDPVSQDVNAGENVTFTVKATGDGPFKYQWMKNGSPVNGQTSATCNITAVTTNQAGTYTCVVSNEFSEKTSKGAKLTVTPTFTLTYNVNGGKGTPPQAKAYASGTRVSIQGTGGISKTGLKCIGWGDGDDTFNSGDKITMSEDITLWAVWQATVIFMNGSSEYAKTTAIEGNPVRNYPNNPSSSTANFRGWATSSNGSGSFVQSTKVSSDMRVYAKWEKKQCTVEFNPNKGSSTPPPVTVDAGSSMGNQYPGSISRHSDEKNDYSFKGWYYNGTEITANTPIQSNMKVRAEWNVIKKPEYYVHFERFNLKAIEVGMMSDEILQKIGGTTNDIIGISGKPFTFPQCGFTTTTTKITFIGWMRADGGDTYQPGQTLTPEEGITSIDFYAMWNLESGWNE